MRSIIDILGIIHIVAISFSALIVTELLMVAFTARKWLLFYDCQLIDLHRNLSLHRLFSTNFWRVKFSLLRVMNILVCFIFCLLNNRFAVHPIGWFHLESLRHHGDGAWKKFKTVLWNSDFYVNFIFYYFSFNAVRKFHSIFQLLGNSIPFSKF